MRSLAADLWTNFVPTILGILFILPAGVADGRAKYAELGAAIMSAVQNGAPLRGKTVDLAEFLRWFHDFLTENRWRLRRESALSDEEAAVLSGADSVPGGEHWRLRALRATAMMKELDLAKAEGRLIGVPVIHDQIQKLCAAISATGDRLAAEYGQQVADELNAAIDVWHGNAVAEVMAICEEPEEPEATAGGCRRT